MKVIDFNPRYLRYYILEARKINIMWEVTERSGQILKTPRKMRGDNFLVYSQAVIDEINSLKHEHNILTKKIRNIGRHRVK
jgi:hypothetical protein